MNHSSEMALRIRNGTFLVVDDFDAMRKVTSSHLRQQGASKLVEAGNGAEAMRILLRQPVTLILSDWNMPVMTGLELLQQVRAHPRLSATPFLMITAEAERERVLCAIQAGVSELLVKPYTAALLAERVQKALNWQPRRLPAVGGSVGATAPASSDELAASVPAQVAVPQRSSSVPGQRPTVLLVDDTPDNLHLLTELFQGESRIKVANNGEKALSI